MQEYYLRNEKTTYILKQFLIFQKQFMGFKKIYFIICEYFNAFTSYQWQWMLEPTYLLTLILGLFTFTLSQSEEKKKVLVSQSCPTLCNPTGCVAHQALQFMELSRQTILEWVAIPYSRKPRIRFKDK